MIRAGPMIPVRATQPATRSTPTASGRSRRAGHEHPYLLDAARHHLEAERRQVSVWY
jgi:hypothetical protein